MKKITLINGQDRRLLNRILKFSRARDVCLYIVGGFLRDAVIGRLRVNPDIDFAVAKGAIKFAAALAKHLRAGFVILDKENGCARLVKKDGDKVYTLDFTDFRGKDLLQDLAKRDFTINTLAAGLNEVLSNPKNSLIDPYEGLQDLKKGIIRVIAPKAYDEDPLRILRTFSLSCMLDFKIKPDTLRSAESKKGKLKRVSFERIRDELFKILCTPVSFKFLKQLDRYKIMELIIPEIRVMQHLRQGPYHHLDVWAHTLESLKQLEGVVKAFWRNQDIRNYLNEEISSGRSRLGLLKLGCLLHDIGKPGTLRIQEGKVMFHGHERLGANMLVGIAQRLKLSNDEIASLRKMVLWHLRPGYLADVPVLTQRARFRFFRDASGEALSVLLISLADQRATRGYLTTKQSRQRHERVVRRLIKEYLQGKKEKKEVRLVNGHDLIKRFKLTPSPLIGRLLMQIEEEQAIGSIKTKEEALMLAARIIKKGA